ncbi:DUF3761 domain-containing protein [Mycobacterium sp.]|uniref:DUF3761 domain-containing protein n=1 Tax=Mycobacterium sp. TaxID=1785 RepID=UPI002622E43C|nr:DUF3761 domain-containing protein [Mycobacterium sp.]
MGSVAASRKGGVPTPPSEFHQCPSGTYRDADGDCVERPDQNTNSATAICCDGSESHSKHRSGTCSGHGGVCQWNTPGAGYSDNPENRSAGKQRWV